MGTIIEQKNYFQENYNYIKLLENCLFNILNNLNNVDAIKRLNKNTKIVIWGTGTVYECNKKLLTGFQLECFIDNNVDLQGTTKNDVTINSPSYLINKDVAIIIMSSFYQEILMQLVDLNYDSRNIIIFSK